MDDRQKFSASHIPKAVTKSLENHLSMKIFIYFVKRMLEKHQNIASLNIVIISNASKKIKKRNHLAPFSVKRAWKTYYYFCNNSIWIEIGVPASEPFQAHSDTEMHLQELQYATGWERAGWVPSSSNPVQTRQLLAFTILSGHVDLLP